MKLLLFRVGCDCRIGSLPVSGEVSGWLVHKPIRAAIAGIMLLSVLAGCGGSAIPEPSNYKNLVPTIAIQALQKNTPRNSRVYLQGTVGDRVPVLDGTVYELQDATGKIWVLTKHPTPEKGQEIFVKGILRYKSIPLNGKEQGSLYVEQQE